MVSAIVMLNVERALINQVAEDMADLSGVSEVFSVSGQYDLVAILRVPDNDALADLVTGQMAKIKGILESETMIAFNVLSKNNMEAMFSIGME